MYAPDAFVAPNPAAIARAYPFAVLTTFAQGQLFATSTPLFFDSGDTGVLLGHLARSNPQAAAMQAGQPFLATFSGPSAYVSASWFRARPSVPTWNYVAAQVRGELEPVDDEATLLAILRHTAALAEADVENPWVLEHAPEGRVSMLLPRIRGVRLKVEQISGIEKLSQIHPPSDIPLIIRELLQRRDPSSTEVARLMSLSIR